MDGAAARHEARKVLAELPDRISDVIKPFARESPDHPALVHGHTTWTYADLAAISSGRRPLSRPAAFGRAIGS
jgi:hypothetical protein